MRPLKGGRWLCVYKGASQKMQHALRVDRIDQRGVYLGDETPGAALPDFVDMTLPELKAERETLVAENIRWIQQGAAFQQQGNLAAKKRAGEAQQTICKRLSLVNAEIKRRNKLASDAFDQKYKPHFWKLLVAEIGEERARQLQDEATALANAELEAGE